ncbi:MAG: hypothetical protein LBR38_06965 [Synergistaceae bacterium]|jgi:hypothetical protein|nr:hypothetical protein [Synergistaceae bacterium]
MVRSAILVICLLFRLAPAWADGDSAEAFMSATFGLSSTRTQKRMETSGASVAAFSRAGQLTMKGTFESMPAIFVFGFGEKKGLNHKSAYIGSTGDAASDRQLYDAFRAAYNERFGTVKEITVQHPRVKGRIAIRSNWTPDKYTMITLSYDPEVVKRFPGDSPGDYPIHLIYNYLK